MNKYDKQNISLNYNGVYKHENGAMRKGDRLSPEINGQKYGQLISLVQSHLIMVRYKESSQFNSPSVCIFDVSITRLWIHIIY